jgi:hypothetical protein
MVTTLLYSLLALDQTLAQIAASTGTGSICSCS